MRNRISAPKNRGFKFEKAFKVIHTKLQYYLPNEIFSIIFPIWLAENLVFRFDISYSVDWIFGMFSDYVLKKSIFCAYLVIAIQVCFGMFLGFFPPERFQLRNLVAAGKNILCMGNGTFSHT